MPAAKKRGEDDGGERAAKAPKVASIIPSFQGVTVYTDGSSRGNGRTGAVAGYGVYWDEAKYHSLNLARRLAGPVQTNNRAELTAILRAVQVCPEPRKPLRIFTDSQYAINALTKWLPGWQRNGWRTAKGEDVLNKDLMVALHTAFTKRPVRPTLVYVRGHMGTYGNEMADQYVALLTQTRESRRDASRDGARGGRGGGARKDPAQGPGRRSLVAVSVARWIA